MVCYKGYTGRTKMNRWKLLVMLFGFSLLFIVGFAILISFLVPTLILDMNKVFSTILIGILIAM